MFEKIISNKFVFSLIFLCVFLGGFHMSMRKVLGSDFSQMPGDMGDSRFINTILEHNYQWMIGNTDGIWEGSFMYPEKKTITFSDNLIGNLPLYAPFRLMGFSEYDAFQYWMLSFIFLNFLCGYIAFRYFTANRYHALLGAFLFTYSLALICQYFHIQMAVRFMIPLFFLFAHKYFDTGKNKYLWFACLSFVMQFYISMYLGFLLLFCGAVYISALFIYKFKNIRFNRQFMVGWGIAAVSTALLLLPLVLPYAERAKTTPFTPYEQVIPTIPSIGSYFRPFWDSKIWPTYELDQTGNPYNWLHLLFPGGLLMYALLLLPVTLYLKKDKNLLWFSIVTFIILICFFRVGNTSLFEYIREIPGMASVRMVTRIINILIFFFVIIFLYTTRSLFNHEWQARNFFYFCLFMVLAVYDNKNSMKEYKSFNKMHSAARVNSIVKEVQEKSLNKKYEAFAILSVTKDEQYYNEWQIDAMMAAYRLRMKTVNAYTSFSPQEFGSFWWQHNTQSLAEWLRFKGADSSKVLIIYR